MKIFGWTVFSIGIILGILLLPSIRNVSLVGDSIGGYVMIDRSIPIALLLVPLALIIVGMFLGLSKPKPKQLICPNGCGIVQQGDNYCGQCGTLLKKITRPN
jgi:hypothetical protein